MQLPKFITDLPNLGHYLIIGAIVIALIISELMSCNINPDTGKYLLGFNELKFPIIAYLPESVRVLG